VSKVEEPHGKSWKNLEKTWKNLGKSWKIREKTMVIPGDFIGISLGDSLLQYQTQAGESMGILYKWWTFQLA
jgi:hypothetical protein